jgi:hypothetical protein
MNTDDKQTDFQYDLLNEISCMDCERVRSWTDNPHEKCDFHEKLARKRYGNSNQREKDKPQS